MDTDKGQGRDTNYTDFYELSQRVWSARRPGKFFAKKTKTYTIVLRILLLSDKGRDRRNIEP
jgi:hypothetical protein